MPLGQNVQSRLFQAMSHSLFKDKREQMQRHLALMKYLKQGIGQISASEFVSGAFWADFIMLTQDSKPLCPSSSKILTISRSLLYQAYTPFLRYSSIWRLFWYR